jgi:hypothetical protein
MESNLKYHCQLCSRLIRKNQKRIECRVCQTYTHVTCITSCKKNGSDIDASVYFCVTCLSVSLPFNLIEDTHELVNVLRNFFDDFPIFSRFTPNDQQLSLLCNTALLTRDDIDPDSNASQLFNASSSYYLPSEIKGVIDRLELQNKFLVVHINARSLENKLSQVSLLTTSLNIDIDVIAITESWETTDNADFLQIPGFSKVSNRRLDGRKGGGVALFIKDSIVFSVKDVVSKTFESVFIEISSKRTKTKINIGAIYRPPNTDHSLFNDEFEELAKTLTRSHQTSILAGDYNVNLLNCSVHQETNNFLNDLFSNSLIPMITRPTRYGDHSATLIDNILTNNVNDTQFSGIILDDLSDHLQFCYVTGDIVVPTRIRHAIKNCRQINETNLIEFNESIKSISWDLSNEKDVNEAYEIFHNKFSNIYNHSFPLKEKKIKIYQNKHRPWLTLGILNSVKTKNRLYKTFLQRGTWESKYHYIKYKNKLTSIIRHSEKTYYADRFNAVRGNIHDTWKVINKVLQKQPHDASSMPMLSIDGRISEDQNEIAKKCNDFFVNIGPDLAKKIPAITKCRSIYDTLPSANPSSIFLVPCTTDEIIMIINNLQNSSGVGVDCFLTRVIKSVSIEIADPLMHVFNQSFLNGVFPDKLKLAKVIPVFKSEDKLLGNNYRPISLLPVFSKVLEKLMHKRLMTFLVDKFNLLSENQFGFREHHSTHMALLNIIDQISRAMDEKEFCIGVFLDLSKAFDTIDHNILLSKLKYYGVRGIALNWFYSYLTGRSQCVSVGNVQSKFSDIKCGVPQGSILGPLLFIIYINDIVNSSALFKFIMFADDTNLFASNKNLDMLIKEVNSEMDKVSDWLKINKLSLNIKKTNFILFHNRQKRITSEVKVLINGNIIERVVFTKFLGVLLNENLTWSHHISLVLNKVSKNIGVIRRVSKLLPRDIMLTLYTSLIMPYLEYCNIAWATNTTMLLEKLYILQKKIIRIITSSKWNTHSDPLFKEARSLKLHDINILQVAIFMFKAMNNILPSSFANYFLLVKDIHNHETRHKNDIHQIQFRTNLRGSSIRIRGPKIWNAIPVFVKNVNCIFAFKKQLKNIIMQAYL